MAVFFLAFCISGNAQVDATCTKTARFLGQSPRATCDPFVIDLVDTPINVPKAIRVPNEASLKVKVRHLLNQSCSVNFTQASITTTYNPLSVLGPFVSGKAPAGGLFAEYRINESTCYSFFVNNHPSEPNAVAIDTRLLKLNESLQSVQKELNDLVNNPVPDAIHNLSFCIPASDCATNEAFDLAKTRISTTIESLQATLNGVIQKQQALQKSVGAVQQSVEVWKAGHAGSEAKWVQDVGSFFNCVNQDVDALSDKATGLGKQLVGLAANLQMISRIVEDVYQLPLYRNSKVTSNVVCSDKDPSKDDAKATVTASTGDPKTAAGTKPPVPIEIDYQSPSVISGSAGIVISTLGQHVVGIQNRNVPNGSNGFTTYFAVTSHSPAQFIPFSLVHLFLYGTRTNNVNLSGGIGVNTYNGSTQVEYFVGPSLSTHNFYLSAGAHIGRFQDIAGGFKIGNPVPTGWTGSTPVPTSLRYTAHLGFGVTYRIP